MAKERKPMPKWKRNLFIVLGVAAGITVLALIFLVFLPWLSEKIFSESQIEDLLESTSTAEGILLLALLQAVQVISIFLPGAVVQIAGGLVYGTWISFIVCLLSFTATNCLIFYLVRRHLQRKHHVPKGRTKKVLDWINSANPGYMCMLAYMMPGIPNGFVPHAVAYTKVSMKSFAFSAAIGSFFNIFIMCSVGSRLKSGDYMVSFLLVLFSIAVIGILFVTKNRLIALGERLHQKKDTQ